MVVALGSIRIHLTTRTGREILLHHVRQGDSCALSSSCLLGHDTFPATAVSEGPGVMLLVPPGTFHMALARSTDFRQLVFAGLSQRLGDSVARIEELSSVSVEVRLSELLLEWGAAASGAIDATHHDLSVRLGVSREVVSRYLKRFERNGILELSRGRVRLCEPSRLRSLAQGAKAQVLDD